MTLCCERERMPTSWLEKVLFQKPRPEIHTAVSLEIEIKAEFRLLVLSQKREFVVVSEPLIELSDRSGQEFS